MNNKIYIAKLGKTVGLDGAMKLHLDTDFPEQLKSGLKLYTNKNQELTIKSYDKTRSVIRFEGIVKIDDAKKLTNQELWTTMEQTRDNCVLKKGQFFWFDLIGCAILDDKDKMALGIVEDIQRLPSCDYFMIATSKVLVDRGLPQNFLVPYIEKYIDSIEIDSKTIYTKDALAILENS